MGRGMLRTHVDDHGLVVGRLIEFGIERGRLRQAKHSAQFTKSFGRGDDVAGGQLLTAFGGLAHVHRCVVGRGHAISDSQGHP
jgi:hypothetical protein